MQTKILEVRDRNTFIPVLAIQMQAENPGGSPKQQEIQSYFLHGRCGYPRDGSAILLTALDGGRHASADPYFWGDRTWTTAHDFITRNWNDLRDGSVVDVEFILGESVAPKRSERIEFP